VGFDKLIAKKTGLPIVTGITKYTLPEQKGAILLRVHDGVYNKGSRTTLLSELQLQTRGCIVDSTYHQHRGINGQPGTQQLTTPDDEGEETHIIPLRLTNALMTFAITLPMNDDLDNLPIVDLTPEGTWIPSHHNDCPQALSFGEPYFLAQTAHAQTVPVARHNSEDTNLRADDIFNDAHKTLLPDGRHYLDPSNLYTNVPLGKTFHLTMIPTTQVDQFLINLSYEERRGDHETFNSFAYVSQAAIQDQAQDMSNTWGTNPWTSSGKLLRIQANWHRLSFVFLCDNTSRPDSHG
jgi:hypothetical protein